MRGVSALLKNSEVVVCQLQAVTVEKTLLHNRYIRAMMIIQSQIYGGQQIRFNHQTQSMFKNRNKQQDQKRQPGRGSKKL